MNFIIIVCIEILEALSSSSPVPVTTALTTTQSISTVHHHTLSAPSVESNNIVDNVTQQSQGMYICT